VICRAEWEEFSKKSSKTTNLKIRVTPKSVAEEKGKRQIGLDRLSSRKTGRVSHVKLSSMEDEVDKSFND
jgi:hypothetical protein